jgi:prenylcysteine oxidase/farnesylcysteine lyase
MYPKLTLHQVVGIERHSNHTWIIVTEEGRRDYDAVIIAAPYHSSRITLPADLSTSISPQPYVHLHTTLLTTTAATFNPVYFGYKPGSKIAKNIVRIFDGVSRDGTGRASEFNFISYQGQAKFSKNETQETGEWVVKISSMERISDEWLAAMFQNQVGWVQRKEVCPFLPPGVSY